MTETTSQPSPTPPPPPATDGFDRLRALGIARPAEGRWIGGVAAGLARRWNVDPLLVRGIFVALTIVSGIGLLLYGIAWALLPEDDGTIHLQSLTKGDITAGSVGAGLFILLFLVAGVPDHGPGPFWWGLPGVVVVGLIGLAAWWWGAHRKGAPRPVAPPPYGPYGQPPAGTPGGYGTATYGAGTPGHPATYPATGATPRPQGAPYTGGPAYGTPPPRPPIPPQPPRTPRRDPATLASHRITRLTLGIAVLAACAVVLVDQSAGFGSASPAVLAMATALGVIGVGIVAAGGLGRRSGGLAPIGILLAIALAIASAVAAADLRSADRLSVVGDHDWRPASATQAELDYNLGVGDGTLWLTDPRIVGTRTGIGPVRPMAQVGAGTLTVVLPEGVPVEVHADVAGGQLVRPDGSRVRFDGGQDDNTAEVVRTGPAGIPAMVVDARVGFGEIVLRMGTPTGLVSPTALPTVAPSAAPTVAPSAAPTVAPSATPAAPSTPAPTTTPEVTR